jgi:transcriptional regulator with XRE-family HTH domain
VEVTEHPDPLRDLGSFIREQRAGARLSLRRLSELAGISNPYLSQIERGLRRPSAEILQQIAHGLRISAETLYVRGHPGHDRPHRGAEANAPSHLPLVRGRQPGNRDR